MRLVLVEGYPPLSRVIAACFRAHEWVIAGGRHADALRALALREHDGFVVHERSMACDSWSLLERIRAARPEAAVLMLVVYSSPEVIDRAQRYRTELNVDRNWRPAIKRFLGRIEDRPEVRSRALARRCGLTRRELQTLELYVADKSREEIAAALDITERTVRAHFAAITHKTGLGRMAEVRRAIRSLAS